MTELALTQLLMLLGATVSAALLFQRLRIPPSLGIAQVILTTIVAGLGAWLMGLHPVAAFVVGAGPGITLSVFQDITAVPFIIVIPMLGVAAAQEIAGELGRPKVKAAAHSRVGVGQR